MEGDRIAHPEAGIWGILRGRAYDLLVCGRPRWALSRGRGVYDPRNRTQVYMGLEEALALLLEWGFSADTFWQADKYWRQKNVTAAHKPPKLHTWHTAGILLPPRRALAPYNWEAE